MLNGFLDEVSAWTYLPRHGIWPTPRRGPAPVTSFGAPGGETAMSEPRTDPCLRPTRQPRAPGPRARRFAHSGGWCRPANLVPRGDLQSSTVVTTRTGQPGAHPTGLPACSGPRLQHCGQPWATCSRRSAGRYVARHCPGGVLLERCRGPANGNAGRDPRAGGWYNCHASGPASVRAGVPRGCWWRSPDPVRAPAASRRRNLRVTAFLGERAGVGHHVVFPTRRARPRERQVFNFPPSIFRPPRLVSPQRSSLITARVSAGAGCSSNARMCSGLLGSLVAGAGWTCLGRVTAPLPCPLDLIPSKAGRLVPT